MKSFQWVVWLAFFTVFQTGAQMAVRQTSANYKERKENADANYTSTVLEQRDALQREAQYAKLTRNGEQLKSYRTEWQNRMASYDTVEAIRTTLRTTTQSFALQMVETDQTHRVVENSPRSFRINWQFTGTAERALAWMSSVQEQIDTINFIDVQMAPRAELLPETSKIDPMVNVQVEAEVKLQ